MFTVICSLYLSVLCQFAFVSHPVVYCFLLLLCSVCVAVCSYTIIGFSWYMALFCLVYIGGVYVLFIFVSVHTPNPISCVGSNYFVLPLFFPLFVVILNGLRLTPSGVVESSHYLCSGFEGYTYCFFCVTLLAGFAMISVVSSDKSSFYR